MEHLASYQTEKPTRTLLKAISWRIFGTLTTILVTYTFTNDATIATTVGGFEFFAKILFFYAHERLWIKLNGLF